MKKLLFITATLFLLVSFSACSTEEPVGNDDNIENGNNNDNDENGNNGNNDNNDENGDDNSNDDNDDNDNIPTGTKFVKQIKFVFSSTISSTIYQTMKCEYDSDNRVSYIDTPYYAFDPFTYTYDGNKVTMTDNYDTFYATLNEDGTIARVERWWYGEEEFGPSTLDFSYKNGYLDRIYPGNKDIYFDFIWEDCNLTEIVQRLITDDMSYELTKYVIVYDENQPEIRSLNVDIVHLLMSALGHVSYDNYGTFYWFFGKHSRLYPTKYYGYRDNMGDIDWNDPFNIEYTFNNDKSVASISCKNTRNEGGEFEFSY